MTSTSKLPAAGGIPCVWMRGGTSKGLYFLKDDLPQNPAERDALLLKIMGSPDPRQINGIGGADPLTSKVAVVSRSERSGVDLDYLFLQVFVDQPIVTDAQNCGNILSGVVQFAAERGLVVLGEDHTRVAVYMVNSDQIAQVTIATPGAKVTYDGETTIDGVPGSAAAVLQNFPDAAGANCGALLPTGHAVDEIEGVAVTLIDNGMPVMVLRASDVGISGYETRDDLDANNTLKKRIESMRLIAGPMMNLGDVSEKSVPKITLVAPAKNGGAIHTRTFIPHRCHASIGVLGAVSVATACILPHSPAGDLADLPSGAAKTISVEHAIGEVSVMMDVSSDGGALKIHQAAIVRTARKLFEGQVFA